MKITRMLKLVVYLFLSNTAFATTDTWLNNGDGTVTDLATGLIWQRATNPEPPLSQSAAISYCQTLSLAGKTDWRLPNVKELTSIVDFRASVPAIDNQTFDFYAVGNATGDRFWTLTTSAANSSQAWTVDFTLGIVNAFGDKSDLLKARCVRG